MIQLHPQLAKDCHQLGKLPESILLLHKNSIITWFILVPQTQLTDLLDLPEEQRNRVMAECSLVSGFIRKQFGSPKINFGAIGNLVPQMHLHVIGRNPDDACWPQPVWGNLESFESYDEDEISQIIKALKADCGLNTE
ncbi:MAG: HIT family protein [Planctomicrobium sp.]|jgi:diadenosine tetraphosphate (Ap4A) HIT family hydrolase|nr:HIT family protein [Planctomicrobium sp.]